ncbi:MAG: asparagine synthase (glutamine-hydrolyzing) [Nitrospiraceae bacterium]|nr:asparagine synthase (glutamine-hydrolyzing) [Nitrospiraceae bacterium]
MCGFAGFLGVGKCNENTLHRMAATLHHRGPDDHGVWYCQSSGMGFAHSRLSILDLSHAGYQPMVSSSGRYVIAFNGEIYNHLALRVELEQGGHVPNWRGHSDTETLLMGFDVWGIEGTVQKSVGMFAFGVWDKDARTLTLGRDRLGEKPLYYGWQDGIFLFGSELKALKAHPAFKAEIDRNALAALMRYSYIPEPLSIYHDIHKLLPSALLTVTAGEHSECKPSLYWSLLDVASKGLQRPFLGSDSEAIECLEARLSDAVSLQQIADVPLGVVLSGGIDSSMIVALMQAQASRPIQTFTIGFSDYQYNEAVHASAVARHLGTDHTELYVSPEEARAVIPRLPVLYDEPFADSSQIPTFLVSQMARRSVTVSLSGDGGDELFGGYNRYTWTRKILNVPVPLRQMLKVGIAVLSPSQWDRLYVALQTVYPGAPKMHLVGDKAYKLASVLSAVSGEEIYQHLVSIWSDSIGPVVGEYDGKALSHICEELLYFDAPEHRMMALDAVTYLPGDILCKVDRASMGASLETRVPFLDHRVVEFAWSLPLHMKIRNGKGKWILRQLLNKYVPNELTERPKMGFSVPIGTWLRGPLREWAEDLLDDSALQKKGFFNPVPIRKKWAEHLSGHRNWQYHLWNVLMFQAWLMEQG